MTSAKSYKKALNKEEAINTLQKESGTQFDPKFARIFIDILNNNESVIRGQTVWEVPSQYGSDLLDV